VRYVRRSRRGAFVTGRVAVACSTCGVHVAFVSVAAIERTASTVPAAAAALLAARFVHGKDAAAAAMKGAADAIALRCCTCEGAAIAAAALPHGGAHHKGE
jgi:predicted transcriptional regulator